MSAKTLIPEADPNNHEEARTEFQGGWREVQAQDGENPPRQSPPSTPRTSTTSSLLEAMAGTPVSLDTPLHLEEKRKELDFNQFFAPFLEVDWPNTAEQVQQAFFKFLHNIWSFLNENPDLLEKDINEFAEILFEIFNPTLSQLFPSHRLQRFFTLYHPQLYDVFFESESVIERFWNQNGDAFYANFVEKTKKQNTTLISDRNKDKLKDILQQPTNKLMRSCFLCFGIILDILAKDKNIDRWDSFWLLFSRTPNFDLSENFLKEFEANIHTLLATQFQGHTVQQILATVPPTPVIKPTIPFQNVRHTPQSSVRSLSRIEKKSALKKESIVPPPSDRLDSALASRRWKTAFATLLGLVVGLALIIGLHFIPPIAAILDTYLSLTFLSVLGGGTLLSGTLLGLSTWFINSPERMTKTHSHPLRWEIAFFTLLGGLCGVGLVVAAQLIFPVGIFLDIFICIGLAAASGVTLGALLGFTAWFIDRPKGNAIPSSPRSPTGAGQHSFAESPKTPRQPFHSGDHQILRTPSTNPGGVVAPPGRRLSFGE